MIVGDLSRYFSEFARVMERRLVDTTVWYTVVVVVRRVLNGPFFSVLINNRVIVLRDC